MSEGLVIGAWIGFGLSLLLLIGLIASQLSAWRYLRKRYKVPRSLAFHEWLDSKLEDTEDDC